jgi:hypothetical protein
MERGMGRKELASKCWDAANGVTAFACAQMVAFLLSLLSHEVQLTVKDASNRDMILISVVAFWLLYSGCIRMVSNAGFRLLEHPESLVIRAWKQALWGRLAIVFIFSALSFVSPLVP